MRAAAVSAIGLLLLVAGCTKPDEVKTLETPLPGLTMTFETWNNGPLVSDRTKLVAHYVHDGKEDREVIFDGDYVVISKYEWARPRRLILCYKRGLVANFRNEVDFWVKNELRSFHVTLKEDC
jgi:hypothetical protein